MIDVSIVLTAHREGVLAGATARSACAAIRHAQTQGRISCELVIVLDAATRETRDVLQHGFADVSELPLRILEVATGDPGQSRNIGVAAAQGACTTFLDGDDLWSVNWLTEAWKFCAARPDAIGQSMCNVTFGQAKNIWWHVDSEGPLFDPRYLAWGNYWDAMSFARTEIYRSLPFRGNDLELGFGHEDWDWSILTHARGMPHKPVPQTIHFKRRRANSQMSAVEKAGAVVWPIPLPEAKEAIPRSNETSGASVDGVAWNEV